MLPPYTVTNSVPKREDDVQFVESRDPRSIGFRVISIFGMVCFGLGLLGIAAALSSGTRVSGPEFMAIGLLAIANLGVILIFPMLARKPLELVDEGHRLIVRRSHSQKVLGPLPALTPSIHEGPLRVEMLPRGVKKGIPERVMNATSGVWLRLMIRGRTRWVLLDMCSSSEEAAEACSRWREQLRLSNQADIYARIPPKRCVYAHRQPFWKRSVWQEE